MAKGKEEEKEGGAEAEAAKPKSKKKLIFIVVGLVVLLAGVGVPMFLMKGSAKTDAEQEEEVKEEVKKIKLADMGLFVVNLSESSSFLKVGLKAEYDAGLLEELEAGGHGGGKGHGGGGAGGEEKEDALPHAMKEREPIIRDAVIRVLSSKHVDEVLTPDGKEKIKEELIEAINEATALEEPIVTGVFFSEFMVQ